MFVWPLLLLLARSVAGGGESTVLRVGMEPRQPPWSFLPGVTFRRPHSFYSSRLDELRGLDVDVMAALGRRMGTTMQIVPTAWDDLEKALLEERYDLILSAWTPTPKTPNSIVASVPYCNWGLLIAVRADNKSVQSYRDLEGLKVGHVGDPAVETALAAMGHGKFQVRAHQDILFEDLKSGVLDAVIYDSLYVRWHIAHDPSLRVVGEPLNRLGYHVGVRNQDRALFERVQAALRDLVASRRWW